MILNVLQYAAIHKSQLDQTSTASLWHLRINLTAIICFQWVKYITHTHTHTRTRTHTHTHTHTHTDHNLPPRDWHDLQLSICVLPTPAIWKETLLVHALVLVVLDHFPHLASECKLGLCHAHGQLLRPGLRYSWMDLPWCLCSTGRLWICMKWLALYLYTVKRLTVYSRHP